MMNILEYINGSDIQDLKNKLVDVITNTEDDKLLKQIDSVVWTRYENSISKIEQIAENKLIDKYIKTIINTVLGNGDNLKDFLDIIDNGYLTIDEVIENINNDFTSKIPLIDLVFNKIHDNNKDISRETLEDLANLKFNGMGRFELFLALFINGAKRPKQGVDIIVNEIKFELKDHSGILKGRGKYNVNIQSIKELNNIVDNKFSFPIKNNSDFNSFINYVKSIDDNNKEKIIDDIVNIYIDSWDAYNSIFQEKYKEGFKNFLLNIHNTKTAYQDFLKWISYYMLYSYCYNDKGNATFNYLLITAAGNNGEYKLLKMPNNVDDKIFDSIINVVNDSKLIFDKYPRLDRDSSHNIEIYFKPNENTNRISKKN